MRRLLILRGAPKSGKTYWSNENGLAPYTISIDEIRRLYSSPKYDIDGSLSVPANRPLTGPLVSKLLIERMAEGQLVILDGRHMQSDEIRGYKALAQDNRYRVNVVDFSDVPKGECISRVDDARTNGSLSSSEAARDIADIELFYALGEPSLPSGFEIVAPQEALALVEQAIPHDLSRYRAINFFGDIHGCHTALMEMMGKLGCDDGKLRDDEFYVFCGDYIDRGLENAQTLAYLMPLVEQGNVVMLEGNHERWLDCWAHGKEAKSKTFNRKTAPELAAAGTDKKEVARFYRRLIPMTYVRDADARLVYACHGGIPTMPKPFSGISTRELIKGVGEYSEVDEVNASWEATSGERDGIYQVHGHRQAKDTSSRPFVHVFSLEGGVEHGGELRVARFESGKEPCVITVQNTVFDHIQSSVPLSEMTFEDALDNLRANPMIKEKKLPGGVSSFNFTREAFLSSSWGVQTIKARGLFIDTDNDMIMARSYDKFFNIGEKPETQMEALMRRLVYPVSVYKKENGYLGIAAPMGEGKLFFASKSTTQGDYAVEFKKLLISTLGGGLGRFADYLEDIDASAVFEVIIPSFDRHIVEYDKDKPHVVLLDVIYNDFEYDHIGYDELSDIGARFKLPVKAKSAELHTKGQFTEWYAKVSATGYVPDDGTPIEGYVLEDANGFMVKVKTDWYAYWKKIRSVIHDVMKRSKSSRISELQREHPEVEPFYEWLKRYVYDWRRAGHKDEDPCVIDVRNAWEAEQAENA